MGCCKSNNYDIHSIPNTTINDDLYLSPRYKKFDYSTVLEDQENEMIPDCTLRNKELAAYLQKQDEQQNYNNNFEEAKIQIPYKNTKKTPRNYEMPLSIVGNKKHNNKAFQQRRKLRIIVDIENNCISPRFKLAQNNKNSNQLESSKENNESIIQRTHNSYQEYSVESLRNLQLKELLLISSKKSQNNKILQTIESILQRQYKEQLSPNFQSGSGQQEESQEANRFSQLPKELLLTIDEAQQISCIMNLKQWTLFDDLEENNSTNIDEILYKDFSTL